MTAVGICYYHLHPPNYDKESSILSKSCVHVKTRKIKPGLSNIYEFRGLNSVIFMAINGPVEKPDVDAYLESKSGEWIFDSAIF